MKTITDIRNEFQVAREDTRKAFKTFMSNKTIENYEAYKITRARRIELNAMIQSW